MFAFGPDPEFRQPVATPPQPADPADGGSS